MNRASRGVRELNSALQRALNPLGLGSQVSRSLVGDSRYATRSSGQKTITTRRCSTGDVGIIERISLVEQRIVVHFDERLVRYDFGELDEISLAYAITIHKSRGSEFAALFVDRVGLCRFSLLRRLTGFGVSVLL
jgi:exodeoxyribonuclease V alpha subunit